MKTALCFQFLNESPWLKLHLPVILESGAFAGVVACDGGSNDDSAVQVRTIVAQYELPLTLIERKWDWDFAAQQNAPLVEAEKQYDACFKWDPDEVLYPYQLNHAAALLRDMRENGTVALMFPRINFEGSRYYYCHTLYPDWQVRLFRLDKGIRWHGRLHASTRVHDTFSHTNNHLPDTIYEILQVPHIPIFHYEGLKSPQVRRLKQINYWRVSHNLAPFEALPEGETVLAPLRASIAYAGEHPLGPPFPDPYTGVTR